jgi:hypothetical protein
MIVGMIGTLSVGYFSNAKGRKLAALGSYFIAGIGTIGVLLAPYYWLLFIFYSL